MIESTKTGDAVAAEDVALDSYFPWCVASCLLSGLGSHVAFLNFYVFEFVNVSIGKGTDVVGSFTSTSDADATALTGGARTPWRPVNEVIGTWSVALLRFVIFVIMSHLELIWRIPRKNTTNIGSVADSINHVNSSHFVPVAVMTNTSSISFA